MLIQLAAVGVLFFGAKTAKNAMQGEYLAKELTTTDPAAEDDKIPAIKKIEDEKKFLDSAQEYFSDKKNSAAFIGLSLSTMGFAFKSLNAVSLPFTLFASKNIFQTAYAHAKEGKVSIFTLIALSTTGIFFIPAGFFLASFVTNLFIWSNKVSESLTEKSRQKISDIFEKTPEYVWLVVDNVETKTPYEQIKAGDTLVVYAGNIIPADGEIIEGVAVVDQHALTGEFQPVEKELGDTVFSSTILLSGKIYIKVESAGSETTVAKIATILNNTVDFKSNVQMRSEKISSKLVMPALVGGIVAMPFLGFNSALAAINSHPKEKMSLTAPISTLNYLNIAIKHNILIKDGRSLEMLNDVDMIVFDKTGTLTEEQPYVGQVYSLGHYSETEILTYAAAAEYRQHHPLAKAIVNEAEQRDIEIPVIDDAEYKLGHGVTVVVQGKTIRVGSARFMEAENLVLSDLLTQQQTNSQNEGYTLVMVAIDDQVCGAIELLPKIRDEIPEIIHYLHKHGKKTCIISGDHDTPTRKLAEKLGIDEYFAQVLPQGKAEIIKELQEEGYTVCYVGDGINDAIALKQANVAVSLNGASSIAVDTAEVILMDHGLSHLPLLFGITEKYQKNMNMTLAIMLVPAAISIGGVFLLHYGLAQTIVFNMVGLVGGMTNAMLPALKHNVEDLEQKSDIKRIS